ncbi:unnamed protein product [Prunus armeniaca]
MHLKWLRLTTLFQLKVVYLYLHTLETWRGQLKATVAFLDTRKQYPLTEKLLLVCLTNLSRELWRKAKTYQIELLKYIGNGKAHPGREKVPLQDLRARKSYVQKNPFMRTLYQIVCVGKNFQCKQLFNPLRCCK